MNAKEKLLEAIIQSEESRTEGVHVTQISFPCLRKAWFERHLGQFGNAQDVFTLWHGRMLHNTPMLPKHELELQWQGIVGSIDEYDPEQGVLIDKKSIRKIYKSYLPQPHHVYQIECYNVLLAKSNLKPASEAHIVYMEKESPHEILDLDITKRLRPIDEVAQLMLQAKQMILQINPPPRTVNEWSCDYCPFVPKCFKFKSISELIPLMTKEMTAV